MALELLTRCLLVEGWHPRHIAGLVRSKFDNPSHGWAQRYWDVYSPGMRADFYVRTFTGELETGIDEAVDLNCVSTQEKGYCPAPGCSADLSRIRSRLLEKLDE